MHPDTAYMCTYVYTLCSLRHKAEGDISHFLSECEVLDGERKALKSTLRNVANENFATEGLISIKDILVVKQVVDMWRFRGLLIYISRHLPVDLNVPAIYTTLCPSLGVCLC